MSKQSLQDYFDADQWLTSQGFSSNGRQIQPEKTSWYRSGVCVNRWELTMHGQDWVSYEIETTFETEPGIWANFKFYSLSDSDIIQKLAELTEKAAALRRSMEQQT